MRNRIETAIRENHGKAYETGGVVHGFFEDPRDAQQCETVIKEQLTEAEADSVFVCGAEFVMGLK